MIITRQADYAIRCVLFLASKPVGIATMIGEIADSMGIPKSFLAKILQRLSKAEIVSSIRGVRGGFVLKRDVSDINLLEVIQSIDGPVAINRCAIDKHICGRSCNCSVHPIWIKLRALIQDYLSAVTFDKLVDTKGSIGTQKISLEGEIYGQRLSVR